MGRLFTLAGIALLGVLAVVLVQSRRQEVPPAVREAVPGAEAPARELATLESNSPPAISTAPERNSGPTRVVGRTTSSP